MGGTKVFLLLYAKIVEVTSSGGHVPDTLERLQAQALEALFAVCASDPNRRQEFLCEEMDSMLRKVRLLSWRLPKPKTCCGFPRSLTRRLVYQVCEKGTMSFQRVS